MENWADLNIWCSETRHTKHISFNGIFFFFLLYHKFERFSSRLFDMEKLHKVKLKYSFTYALNVHVTELFPTPLRSFHVFINGKMNGKSNIGANSFKMIYHGLDCIKDIEQDSFSVIISNMKLCLHQLASILLMLLIIMVKCKFLCFALKINWISCLGKGMTLT